MLFFANDYGEGAHPKVLEHFVKTNLVHASGYGDDPFCKSATEKIRAACECPEAEIFYLVGGTQTNAVACNALLKPFEGVVAADTAHVSTHEAGAIEHGGHKVLTLPHRDGKLDAGELAAFLAAFYGDGNHEHMVFPGMVYLTHPTELGTLYTRAELSAIRAVCDQYRLPLYLDGARLITALGSPDNELTLADIARLCDVFYIGGTKAGALCGEALVFTRKNMPAHFLAIVKQNGALAAKGRLLGVQFDALFTDDLYLECGRHAMRAALRLKAGLEAKGVPFFRPSPTNQQFIVMEDSALPALAEKVQFSFWEKVDATHTAIRFVTSWATTDEDVDALIDLF